MGFYFAGRFYVLALLLAVVVCAFYVPGLTGGFILDDGPSIVRNEVLHLQNFSLENIAYSAYSFQPGGGSRALSMFSFALDYWLYGLNPWGFKLTNLIIHGVTCVVLSLFLRQLLVLAGWRECLAWRAALVGVVIWGIHPLQVSAVLYVVQRMQTLNTLFMLLALLAYLRVRSMQIRSETGVTYSALCACMFGLLAFAAKEDAVLLPLYCFVLEVFVLRFRAGSSLLACRIKQGYTLFLVFAAMVYFFVLIPHYWSWGDYPGRTFTTQERLLTQARVLALYLSQIFIPVPDNMKFFYDDFRLSTGILAPPMTLCSLFFLGGILLLAWCVRGVVPLFSLGVFWFFVGHFITSNVVNLELVFEHRNHLPLVGIVLFVLSVIDFARRIAWQGIAWGGVGLFIVLLASGTAYRSYLWGDNLRLAEYSLSLSRSSERAWAFLCGTHFDRSKGAPNELDKAIETCQEGMQTIPGSVSMASNVMIYKTIRGDVNQADWDALLQRLDAAPMTVQVVGIMWVILGNAERGQIKNEKGVISVIDSVSRRAVLNVGQCLRIAAYLFNQTHEPYRSYAFMARAVSVAPAGDAKIEKMYRELTAVGREDWVMRLKQGLPYEGVR